MALLSTADAVALVEDAQIASPPRAAAILATLPPRIRSHPDLTAPVLDLLQVHPHETLPHIPDLLSPTCTAPLLQLFSTLLSSDRTLLLPILGTLPSLPLTASQTLETRATLAYALAVADPHDLPAVVRTLSHHRAAWAASILRARLRLTPAIAPVVAEALRDCLTPRNALGAHLLAAQAPPRPLDFLLLAHALQRRLVRPARRAVARLVTAGAFARSAYPRAVVCLAPALTQCSSGVARLLSAVCATARPHPEEVAAVARFCASVVAACPAAAVGVPAAGFVPSVVLTYFVSRADHPSLRLDALHPIPSVAVHVLAKAMSPAWAPLYISIRKGAMFGTPEDRARVAALSHAVVRDAPTHVLRELFGVLHSCLHRSLVDDLAVVLMDLLGDAAMRDVFFPDLFEERVVTQLPPGLLSTIREDGTDKIKIDIGLIWRQNPTSVATVVSSAIAVTLVSRKRNIDQAAKGLLDVSVLVPVICISIYQAVEDMDIPIVPSPSNERSPKTRKNDRSFAIPATLKKLSSIDLSTAVSSFATGMATIVGLLNRSSRSLKACFTVVERRHRRSGFSDQQDDPGLGNHTGDDDENSTTMWMLLDRLTEFERMRNALTLAYEVLQWQKENAGKDPAQREGSQRSKLRKQRDLREAVEAAQHVHNGVMSALHGDDGGRRRGQGAPKLDFPMLSLRAIVSSLIAVPDEEGIHKVWDDSVCKQTRDLELVRIDKILLSMLLTQVTLPFRSENLDSNCGTFAPVPSATRNHRAADWAAQNYFDVDELSRRAMKDAFPDLEKQLDEKEDVFMSDEESADEGSCETSSEKGDILWARPNVMSSDASEASYVTSTTAWLLGDMKSHETTGSDMNVASVLHSPAFAALLLDRAATYVAVAWKARRCDADQLFLADTLVNSGLALGCLNAVLRMIPSIPVSAERDSVKEYSAGETEENSCKFLNRMGERLRLDVPPGANIRKSPNVASHHLEETGVKVMSVLEWIIRTSIDAVVASAAIEGVLSLAEINVVEKSYARQLALTSLFTIHEYGNEALWKENKMDLLLRNIYVTWMSRRRNSQEHKHVEIVDDALDAPDQSPWIHLKQKKGQKSTLEWRRLSLLFSGMHIPDAMVEGCAWLREVFRFLSSVKEAERGKTATMEKIASRSRRSPRQPEKQTELTREHHRVLSRGETRDCEILLDVIGVKTLIEFVVDLALQGLQSYTVSVSLPVEDTTQEWSNPILHLQTSLRLVCGLVHLYRGYRDSSKAADKTRQISRNVSTDGVYDQAIMSSLLTVLQMIRSRVDELLGWYANASTDVSQITTDTNKAMHEIIGATMLIVKRCTEVADSIKGEQGEEQMDAVPESEESVGRKARKTPGYITRKRARSVGMVPEELSKARKMVPRLTAQSENVVRSVQKLAKTVGVKATQSLVKLAPIGVEEDESLHFGIGLTRNTVEQNCDQEGSSAADVDGSEAGRSKTTAEELLSEESLTTAMMQDVEIGFHTRSSKREERNGIEEETITVNFKRAANGPPGCGGG